MTAQRGSPASAGATILAARPLYQQARDLLIRRIIEGVWKPGHYLPSETQLASELGISIGTVRKATEDLVEQGRLERLHGRGTRVAAHSSSSIRFRFFRFVHPDGKPFEPIGRIVERRVERPSAEERDVLDLDAREKILVLIRERREKGPVLAVERIVLPAARFGRLRVDVGADMTEELYVLYQEQCGTTIVRTRDQAGFGLAPDDIGARLGIDMAMPVLTVQRVAVSLDEKPMEWRTTYTAALRYQVELD